MLKSLLKILSAFAVVLFFYFCIATSGDTGFTEVKYKAWASFSLIFILLFISTEWYCISIAVIELILTLISFSVLATWATDDILDLQYGAIQFAAFQLELAIICTAFVTWLFQYAKSRRNNHRSISDTRIYQNRDSGL